MPTRGIAKVVELPALEVAQRDEVDTALSSSGPLRSQPRRSARRKSPYEKPPPGPPTTGLSGPLCSMSMAGPGIDPFPRSGGRSGKQKVVKAGDLVSLMAKGPIARQQAKEKAWKSRLTQEKSSWWDAAAIGASGASGLHPDSISSSGVKAELRTLCHARNHARADLRSVAEWRHGEIDSFVGQSPTVAPTTEAPSPIFQPTSIKPEHSPGHYDRKYGGRKGLLPPLKRGQRSKLQESALRVQQHETRNAEARRAAFSGR